MVSYNDAVKCECGHVYIMHTEDGCAECECRLEPIVVLARKAAEHSVQLTAFRRGLNLSFSVNIFLAVLLVLALIGGN